MAKGIAIGVTGREDYESVLMTYHPSGSQTSSTWFHNDPWLSFNMQQTGHGPAATSKPWEKIAADYERTPVKPVVEGEPLYEDHPIGFVRGVRENGFSSDNHVRQRAYWTLFAGAAGVAYGHHSVWPSALARIDPGLLGKSGPPDSSAVRACQGQARFARHLR